MKHLVVGIDIGSSRTKAVAFEGSKIVAMKTIGNEKVSNAVQMVLNLILLEAQGRSEEVKRIAISGSGGNRLVSDTLLGLPVTIVDEIKAIGLGGLELSGKQRALIVSMGTGTALVLASDGGRIIEHVGGTGVGGGTIEGL
ncbi:MAG: type pantothenate kinase, partial [Thermoproteota archaeon]|nr:type pantothenate kinase [Thermoproteota archaeon]